MLGTPHDVHRFVANSQNAKLWFNDLRKLIFEQKKAFSEVSYNPWCISGSCLSIACDLLDLLFWLQLLTHLTLPDEVYYTVKAKVALPYLASGADGETWIWLV